MPEIIFTNRYFYPDESATSQILSDLAFHLASQGFAVTVIASRLSYVGDGDLYARKDIVRAVKVIRVPTTSFGRTNLIGRSLDYLSFYISAFFTYLWHVKKGDILIAKTDPPLLGVIAGLASLIKGAHLGNWLQDVYPEIAEDMKLPIIKGPLAGVLRSARNWALHRSFLNVVIGRRMKALFEGQGVAPKTLAVIPNWCDDEIVKPHNHLQNSVRKTWGFTDQDFVVGYSGNLGWAHDLETIVQAAILLRNRPNIKFLFVGGGKLHKTLKALIGQHDLSNIVLKPYQPRHLLGESLSASDVHWLSLKPILEGKILPSKLYGIAAAGRPALFIGDGASEVAEILLEHQCGFSFEIGAVDALAAKIIDLSENEDKREHLGVNARTMLSNHYSKAISLSKWESALREFRAPHS